MAINGSEQRHMARIVIWGVMYIKGHTEKEVDLGFKKDL